MAVLKARQRSGQLSSSVLTLDDLQRLIEIVIQINEDCKSRILAIREEKAIATGALFDSPSEKLKLNDYLLVRLQIFGNQGELVISHDPVAITKNDLPFQISKVKIDNLSAYNYLRNKEYLEMYFDLELDFSCPAVFDLLTSPTRASANSTRLLVNGENTVWVEGAYGRIQEFFKPLSTFRGIIHKENVYDFLLWALAIPAILFSLLRFEKKVFSNVFLYSVPAQTLLYLVTFFFLLLTFRVVFNYGRWLFPYLELVPSKHKLRTLQRYIYGAVCLGLLGSITFELVKVILSALT